VLSHRRLLTLYGLQGCHLCDDMREALELLRRDFDFDVRELDVDCDPEIETRFAEHIPVLTDGEYELCRHFFDAEAVRCHLAECGQSPRYRGEIDHGPSDSGKKKPPVKGEKTGGKMP
jgi:hypothetical protein